MTTFHGGASEKNLTENNLWDDGDVNDLLVAKVDCLRIAAKLSTEPDEIIKVANQFWEFLIMEPEDE